MTGKEKARARRLKSKYGITIDQYNKMLKLQKGVCAICEKPPKKIRLAVDHDHKPPYRVRGLLNTFCNRRMVGRGQENPEMHRRAADYLESDFDGRNL